MPAKSISPDVSAASFVVGSSTTTTMKRSSRGGPPSAGGKAESAANTQRRWDSCATNRNGPFPTGRSFHAARRSSPCGTRSEEHTSELQSHSDLVCRLLLEKKKKKTKQKRQ